MPRISCPQSSAEAAPGQALAVAFAAQIRPVIGEFRAFASAELADRLQRRLSTENHGSKAEKTAKSLCFRKFHSYFGGG
jgi:hypothetical protein